MKKTLIYIICIVLIILSVIGTKYLNFKEQKSLIQKYNLEYEVYLNQDVTGRELTTAINRAVNNNEKNSVQKDEKGFYIEDDNNSVKIEIKILDNDTTYQMETLYNGGMENFIQYYGDINFNCSKIDYNSKGKVSHIIFEQKN
mgnify:FL=1